MILGMTSDEPDYLHGFPEGYFVIRSAACKKRVWDVTLDEVEDGTEIILWPEKETALVESRRDPHANNQVFFMDTNGALCSRSSGHALDVDDERLVLRHRRPVSFPFPNAYSHPLPQFSYSSVTGEITVTFSVDPAYPPKESQTGAWRNKTYLVSYVPQRKPRTLLDDASEFISSALASPLSLFGGQSPQKPRPDEVFDGSIDLKEDEVLEEDRGQEGEVDDSPDLGRKLRVVGVVNKSIEDWDLLEETKARRRWQVIPLRTANARTGPI